MNLSRPLLLTAGCALVVLAAQRSMAGSDSVLRQYEFNTADISEIEFNGSAGEMHFEPSRDGKIHVELEIEPEDSGWFSRSKDIDDVELESRTRGSRLVLTQDEEKTRTTWRVQLPEVASTRINLGVGDIEGVFGATALNVDLGVGGIDVELPLASTGDVDLSVGVGEARLRGGERTKSDRAFVSQDVRGRGDGDKDLRIEVGVGDIDASLR